MARTEDLSNFLVVFVLLLINFLKVDKGIRTDTTIQLPRWK